MVVFYLLVLAGAFEFYIEYSSYKEKKEFDEFAHEIAEITGAPYQDALSVVPMGKFRICISLFVYLVLSILLCLTLVCLILLPKPIIVTGILYLI
jgi:hypothetical protein